MGYKRRFVGNASSVFRVKEQANQETGVKLAASGSGVLKTMGGLQNFLGSPSRLRAHRSKYTSGWEIANSLKFILSWVAVFL
jgi:hypothetical protein